MASTRVLFVHGIGHQETQAAWRGAWAATVTAELQAQRSTASITPSYFLYDNLFAAAPQNTGTWLEALGRLSVSGVWHGVGDLLSRGASRGPLSDWMRWYPGMVAQWAADERLRSRLCAALASQISAETPDVVVAHSLGSLVAYDAFRSDPSLIRDRWFITLGSQIGNPSIRFVFGGRVEPLETARHWYHLYNPNDKVFAAHLGIMSPKVSELDATFDTAGFADHDALCYFKSAEKRVWMDVAGIARGVRRIVGTERRVRAATRPDRSQPRALLVGINRYRDPTMELEGCVNDVYRVSETLQDIGFPAEQIRIVLDERATAEAIRERLAWLLDGTESGTERVFYFSGHGAQMPAYGGDEKIDHLDECLVPHDFAWTKQTAIIDDHLHELYAQLPYNAQFVMMLDCCHAGGMARGSLKVRGIDPPQDIRHRILSWSRQSCTWRQRSFLKRDRVRLDPQDRDSGRRISELIGSNGGARRLGRAAGLWCPTAAEYDRARARYRHAGPYSPIILEACREEESAFEHRHGVVPYGAFTFCVTNALREFREKKRPPRFRQLFERASKLIKSLGYAQTPNLQGPRKQVAQFVPGRF